MNISIFGMNCVPRPFKTSVSLIKPCSNSPSFVRGTFNPYTYNPLPLYVYCLFKNNNCLFTGSNQPVEVFFNIFRCLNTR